MKLMEKVLVYKKWFTMVVIIGRIVADTCFWRKAGMSLRQHWLLGEACKSLTMSLIDEGGNYDKTLWVREGWNEEMG